ncbi:MAG: hypothetical protein WC516_02140 [Patescibacteria group bacterium]
MSKNKNGLIIILLVVVAALVVVICLLQSRPIALRPEPVACTMEARLCPDGSAVGRSGPKCEFAKCPEVVVDSSWKVATDKAQKMGFLYPEKIVADYISAQEWPPKITVTSGGMSCQETSAMSSLPEQTMKRLIGGRDYCIKLVAEGAAGTIYTTYDYTTQIDDRLVNINFTLRYPQCDNYDDPAKTNCKRERETFNLDLLVNQMMNSIKFN